MTLLDAGAPFPQTSLPDELDEVLLEVARLPWPAARSPELAELARAIGDRALVEALDRPGPKRLGAIRLLGLLR